MPVLRVPEHMDVLIQRIRGRLHAVAPAPAILLVAGGSSTGKSSLVAQALGNAWQCPHRVIAQDMQQCGGSQQLDPRYLRDDPANYGIAACEQALKKFLDGQAFAWPCYDFASATQGPPRVVAPGPLLILEGLYAAQTSLRALASYSIYVEAPAVARLVRRLFRSRYERYPDRPLESRAIQCFLGTVSAAHRDLVVAQRAQADCVVETQLAFRRLIERYALAPVQVKAGEALWSAAYDVETHLCVEVLPACGPALRLWHAQRCYLDLPIDAPTAALFQDFDPHAR
ncbi:MAG: uridine kinase family protein [Panacagrimonas sp.]